MAILTAVLATVLFMTAALVVDLGLARDTRRQAQNAADAASLAAVNVLYGTGTTPRFAEAVQAAKTYAELNFGVAAAEWAACADVDGLRHVSPETRCVSFQNANNAALDQTRPDTVRVRIPARNVPMALGGLAGVSSISVGSLAEAALAFSTTPDCALCVLGPSGHHLQNGDVSVEGGNVHFNGSLAANANGSVTTDKRITVQGGVSGGSYSPAAATGQPAVSDPLAFMPMPNTAGLQQRSNPCTQGPGLYGSHSFPNGSCTLSPGLYVIAGAGSTWTANGEAQVTGVGVTLYFTCGTPSYPADCSPGGSGGTLDMAGSSTFRIEAPTSGPLQGLAIVYDRNNNSTMKIVGSAGNAITGTIYAPAATLQLNGNGCISALKSMIVVKDIVMHGDPSCLTSRYNRSHNVLLPPQELHLSR